MRPEWGSGSNVSGANTSERGLLAQPDDFGDFEDSAEEPSYDRMESAPPASLLGTDGSIVAGFDIGPPRTTSSTPRPSRKNPEPDSRLPLTRDGHLDLTAIADMIRQKQLKEAARLLHAAPDELPDLAHGLNLTALHAYMEDRQHAAQMLWARAYAIDPSLLNVAYNLASVRGGPGPLR